MTISIIVLLLTFIILLSLNIPIALAIGVSTTLSMIVTIPIAPALTTIAQQMATGMNSFALLAIPFFILSGYIMAQGGIANRLINFAKVIVSSFPGGLAYVNIIACMFFGAISGSAAAATSAVGGVMIPSMNKEGYDKNFNTALTVTASTTGLLIPPSNILIIYSLASGGVSISALFIAGYIPGLLIGLSLIFVSMIMARINSYPSGLKYGLKDIITRSFEALPSLLLIYIVIGGIIKGIFTATEASAVAVLYSLFLAFLYKEIKLTDIPNILLKTVETTSIVMLLIGTSKAMSWLLSYLNIPQIISTYLINLTDNIFLLLIIINILLLVVGTFMDMTPAVLIFTPILLPVVTGLGIDPLHFGIIMILNLCIGLCTPPVGSVLFLGCGIGKTSIDQLIKPLLPLYMAMIIILLLITYFPQLSLFLPTYLGY
tara:strand:+ start:8637 stop:9929 length:1293 start_codon:yes stop_codon:yes gene_type:complete